MSIIQDLTAYGKFLHEHGLVIGDGGNISAKEGNYFIIKRKGADMSRGDEAGYIRLSFSGEISPEDRAVSSSEVFIHIASYAARGDIYAVAHAHSPYSVAASAKIKVFKSPSYEFDCIVGKEAPVIPYIQPGSRELGDRVAEKLSSGANAVILKRHGVVAVGKDIREACLRVLAVERACMTL